MAFPTSPTNGQQANINGITYTYSSAATAWTVSTSVSNTFVSINVSDNVNSGNVLATGVISATGNVSGSNLVVTGNIVDTGALTIVTGSNGNITLSPDGTGIVTTTGAISTTGNISANNATFTSNQTLSYGTANGVAYLNGSKVLTTGSALVFDGTNLGVGVTPSAWGSVYKVVQLSGGGAFSGSSGQVNISQNFVGESGGEKYIATAAATSYAQTAGAHRWYNAASGTAGNAITFTQAMTLDINGNLVLAGTSARKRITVGTTTIVATATPEAIDLGATYSNAAGTNLKLLTYNDGITQHGIGVSNASSDYVTIATTGTHCFYAGTVRSVTMDVYGTISGTTSTNRTAAGGTNFPNWLSSTNLGINRNTYFEGNASTGGSNWYGAGTTPYYALDWDSTDQSRWVNNSGAWAKTHALSRNTGMENQYFNPAFVYECVTGATTAASWNYITYNLAGGTRQLSRNSIGYDATATFTAPMAGWYFFAAQVNFSSSADTDGTIKFIINNNFTCYGPSSSQIATGGTMQHPGSRQVSGALYLAGGDYVQVGVYTSAVSTIRGSNPYAGSFSGFFIG